MVCVFTFGSVLNYVVTLCLSLSQETIDPNGALWKLRTTQQAVIRAWKIVIWFSIGGIVLDPVLTGRRPFNGQVQHHLYTGLG